MIHVDATLQGNCNTGLLIAMLATDCHGTLLTADDVSKITYSIYENVPEGSNLLTPNPGHTAVPVPLSSLISPPAEYVCEELGTTTTYNFLHKVSATAALPFPNRNSTYILEYLFYDAIGEPHACTVACIT